MTALPTAMAKINICTAPAPVLESLADNLNGEYSGSPELLANGRKSGLLPRQDGRSPTSWAARRQNVATLVLRHRARISVSRPASRLALREFTLYSLLYRNRNGGGKVTPLLRTFGTL